MRAELPRKPRDIVRRTNARGLRPVRDALDEALWSGRPALPVANAEGRIIGRLTLEALARLGARPQ